MAELILAEQTLSFIKNTQNDIHCYSGDALSLTAGNTYTVVWDGVSYVCVAEDVALPEGNAIALGNKSVDNELFPDGADTKEPFLIGSTAAYNITLFETLETDETHTIAVYKGDTTAGDGDDTEDGYLLKDKTLSFALESGSKTVYYCGMTADEGYDAESAPAITVGNTYTVIWDGVYYECVSKEYTEDGVAFITLGNIHIQDTAVEDTGEPFFYLYFMGSTANFKTLETDAFHVVSIYDGVLEQPVPDGANIVLLDRNGNPVTYEGIKTVSFNTADGKIATFTLSAISSN